MKYTDYIYDENNERATQEVTFNFEGNDWLAGLDKKHKGVTIQESQGKDLDFYYKYGVSSLQYLFKWQVQEIAKRYPKATLRVTIHLEGHE